MEKEDLAKLNEMLDKLSLFDIQNIATHEIGHAINLGHVSDKLQSMYPSSLAGETLKRTLGNGDIRGMSNLY